MDVEMEVVFALWQKIVQAQLVWLKEISDTHGVEVTLSFYEQKYFVHNSDRFSHLVQVLPEIKEMRDGVDRLYANVSYNLGDPNRVAGRYRVADDLKGRTPTEALTQIGLVFIDTVLIGPVNRASALLASNSRLYKCACERAHSINEDGDIWLPRVRQAIAGADALLARHAIDAAMGHESVLSTITATEDMNDQLKTCYPTREVT
jgi:hypothetical protein